MKQDRLTKLIKFLIVLTLALLPIYYLRFKFLGIPTNPIEIIIAITVIISLLKLKIGDLFNENYKKQLLIWVLILGVGLAIGLSQSEDVLSGLGIIKSFFVVPILFYLVLSAYLDEDLFSSIVKAISLSLILVCGYSLLVWLELIPIVFNQGFNLDIYVDQLRAVGFYESPNFLAMYLVPLVIFLIVAAPKDRLVLTAIALGVLTVVLTQSRGAIAALFGCLLLLPLLSVRADRRLKLASVLVIVAGAVFLGYSMRDTDAVRIALWNLALDEIALSPILGAGFDGFHRAVLANFTDPAITVPGYHPHNFFLATWLSSGLFGLIALAGTLWVVLKKAIAIKNLAIFLPLLAVLIHGLVDTTYYKNDLSIIFWFLVAFVIYAKNTTSKNGSNLEKICLIAKFRQKFSNFVSFCKVGGGSILPVYRVIASFGPIGATAIGLVGLSITRFIRHYFVVRQRMNHNFAKLIALGTVFFWGLLGDKIWIFDEKIS